MSLASKLAESLLAKYDNDVGKAAQVLEDRVLANETLFRDLMRPLVGMICYELVGQVVRKDRKAIIDTVKEADTAEEGLRRLISASLAMLDFPMLNGKLLRNASAADCIETAEFYQKQAGDMAGKARWLKAIARRIGSKTVGAVLTEKDAVAMFKKASVL